ncbi:hypothetical protein Hypma_014969 [Hypsizygus marmoreus]|uniref:Uncharacterized protein n=1 Tax=Hypsizygus marmoreus TaxID=39966 RepID=A0A369KAH9_HYPMA|nr:hypothetical protein Hypma_014969 [Hypsizygus marmoreus]
MLILNMIQQQLGSGWTFMANNFCKAERGSVSDDEDVRWAGKGSQNDSASVPFGQLKWFDNTEVSFSPVRNYIFDSPNLIHTANQHVPATCVRSPHHVLSAVLSAVSQVSRSSDSAWCNSHAMIAHQKELEPMASSTYHCTYLISMHSGAPSRVPLPQSTIFGAVIHQCEQDTNSA